VALVEQLALHPKVVQQDQAELLVVAHLVEYLVEARLERLAQQAEELVAVQ
jgi:hypothetical protein